MIGSVLRQARREAGLTQEELAFEAGLSRSYVSFLERDQKVPTIKVLFDICEVLGIRPSEFIARVEYELGGSFGDR